MTVEKGWKGWFGKTVRPASNGDPYKISSTHHQNGEDCRSIILDFSFLKSDSFLDKKGRFFLSHNQGPEKSYVKEKKG